MTPGWGLVVDIRCNELNVHTKCAKTATANENVCQNKPCFFFAAVCFHRGRVLKPALLTPNSFLNSSSGRNCSRLAPSTPGGGVGCCSSARAKCAPPPMAAAAAAADGDGDGGGEGEGVGEGEGEGECRVCERDSMGDCMGFAEWLAAETET